MATMHKSSKDSGKAAQLMTSQIRWDSTALSLLASWMISAHWDTEMQNCKHCTRPGLMTGLCITHWYESRGKQCPEMPPQRPAVNRPVVAVGRQDTSRAAAQNALPKSGSNRARILDYIRANNGATDEEIEIALNLSGNTVRPCRVSLVQDGWVTDSGQRRAVRSGNLAIIWCPA